MLNDQVKISVNRIMSFTLSMKVRHHFIKWGQHWRQAIFLTIVSKLEWAVSTTFNILRFHTERYMMQNLSIVNWHKKSFITYLNSSVSVLNSCSICKNTCTISLIMIGHSEVTCCGDMRNSSTRKQRKTCAWTDGTTWGNRRLSASRSNKEK
jgi:hypothetical protein